MRALLTILHLTLLEAARRRILAATLACGLAFLALYAIGFHYIAAHITTQHAGLSFVRQRIMLNFFTLAGLYAVNFLTLMTSVLLPVDTLSGEIASGVVQTLASKPVRRSEILLGKWLAFVLVAAGYFVLLAGGVLLVARVIGHFTPPGLGIGLPLMLLETAIFVTLSIAGGARLSTVTNGVMVFGLYGLAFIGSWVDEIGTLAGNLPAQNVGTIASLIMPTEALWHRAAYFMQPAIMRDLNVTPFSPASLPSPMMVWWAMGYALVALAFGLRGFAKRAL